MSALRIHALSAGVIHNFPQAAVTYQRGWGQTVEVPQIMFVITGGAAPVVVDTGTPDPEIVREHHGYDFERPESEAPEAQLAGIGVSPDEVQLVINTHLHWDHCGNNALFPRARFVVQRREVDYAHDPLEPTRTAYENTARIRPPWLPVQDRFDVVDGDVELLPGVSVILTPGHTPGSQGVLVETAAGLYLIAGDTVNTYRNWQGDGSLSQIIGGSLWSLPEHLESYQRIRSTGATVIPSHDPEVLRQGVFG